MINAVVDSGFWFALYEPRDEHHAKAVEFMASAGRNLHFVIPFPTLYETVNTRFVKNGHHLKLSDSLSTAGHTLVHDDRYKHDALAATRDSRHLSLVDMIIRMMIEDIDLNIGAVITFNPGDFADICYPRGIAIAPSSPY